MSGWVAGAIVVAGVAAGVGSAVAGSEAAGATKSAANTAAGVQYAALDQQAKLAAPYTAQGQTGIQTYNALTSANPAQVQQTLENTPGYQATYGQGIEAAQRASAAGGLNLSGNQLAGVESFGAQLGDSTYQQAINNALTQEQIGQGAAAGQAANIGSAANNLSNIAIGQGNNIANIDANTIAGISKAGSGAANQLLTYNALQGLNNPGGGGGGGSPTYNPGAVTGIGQPVQDPYAAIST
jgi:hypothetical protein